MEGGGGYPTFMLTLIGILLVLWLVLAIFGFVVKGLLWLALIAVVLFVATATWGWASRRAHT